MAFKKESETAQPESDQEWDKIQYNFECNPVVQPVDCQATGGVDNKNKDLSSKE